MSDRYEILVEKLTDIEEELRDLAYERVVEAARAPDSPESDAARDAEKRLLQARRAIAKAIHALSPAMSVEDE